MMLEPYLELIHEELASLLLVGGALAAAGIMRWASQYYQRVCLQHGTGLAACGLTGQLVAQRLLAKCGLKEVAVVRSNRRNQYHPRRREIQLNVTTFGSPSLLALITAAHEVGHAQQFAADILLCQLRRIFLPLCYVVIGLVVVIIPLLQIAEVGDLPIKNLGAFALVLGVLTLLLQLPIYLPLEYDASRRARKMVQEERLVGPGEQRSFDEVLKAAWLTHAARQAQGCVCLVAVAVLIFLCPSFIGSPEAQAQDPQPAAASLDLVSNKVPDAEALDSHLSPQQMEELLSVGPYFPLLTGVLGLVPCLLAYLILGRFTSSARNKKSPAQRAIERNNAGLVLHEKGAFQAALREFDESLRLDPNLAAAYYNRGQTYFCLGKLDEALADFEVNLRITPGYAYAVAFRAQIWAQRGDFDRAMPEYDAALRLAPENPTLLTLRGFGRLRRNDVEGAFADFESSLHYNPKEPLAHRGRAIAWMSRAELDKALADLDQALAHGDHDTAVFTLRGQVWLSKNDPDRAIAEFTEALRRNGKEAAARRDRGHAWILKCDFGRAIADLDDALRLNPTDAIAFNNRGAALLRKGNYARAAADLREAIRLAPTLPNPHKYLAWLQATCPQPEFRNGTDAVANASRALDLAEWKTTEWLSVLAAAHAEAGNFDEAVKWQTKCLEESPPQLRAELEDRLRIYRARQPFREQPQITT